MTAPPGVTEVPDDGDDIRRHRFAGVPYKRRTKDRHGVLRGTVALADGEGPTAEREVAGFPSIARLYRLQPGLERVFGQQEFVAEEKLDGYNVRLFRHAGRLLASTRGGFICPFTTEWAQIWAEDSGVGPFFEAYPGRVLCGEVIGDNPYNHQRDPELPAGAHFRTFEIVDEQGRFLAPETRYELADRYELPHVPTFGRHHAGNPEPLYDTLRRLDAAGREGVVMKSLDAWRAVKFVTPASDITDILDTMPVAFDLPCGFFQNRYTRASMAIRELALDEQEYARRLGSAFIQGCPRSRTFREASEHYVIHVLERATWELLREQLAQQVEIACDTVDDVRLRGRDMLRIAFRRRYQRSSHRYHRMLQGYLYMD